MHVWVFHFRESLTITAMSEINFDYEMRQTIEEEYMDCLEGLIQMEEAMGHDTTELRNKLSNVETLIINNY